MPTFEADQEFLRDWRSLTPSQRRRFKAAARRFVEDLKAKRLPRPGLGIERFEGREGASNFTGLPMGARSSAMEHLLIQATPISSGYVSVPTTSTRHNLYLASYPTCALRAPLPGAYNACAVGRWFC